MKTYSAGWFQAFRRWFSEWQSARGSPNRVDEEWLRGYKLAFRAGWRAGWRAAMMKKEGKP